MLAEERNAKEKLSDELHVHRAQAVADNTQAAEVSAALEKTRQPGNPVASQNGVISTISQQILGIPSYFRPLAVVFYFELYCIPSNMYSYDVLVGFRSRFSYLASDL